MFVGFVVAFEAADVEPDALEHVAVHFVVSVQPLDEVSHFVGLVSPLQVAVQVSDAIRRERVASG